MDHTQIAAPHLLSCPWVSLRVCVSVCVRECVFLSVIIRKLSVFSLSPVSRGPCCALTSTFICIKYICMHTYATHCTPYRLTDIAPQSSGLFFMTCCLLFGILIGLLTIAISFPPRAVRVCLCVFAAYQATLCEAPQLPVLGLAGATL